MTPTPPPEATAELPLDDPSDLRDALLAWYDEHGRELPWRGIDDPYRTWVSEMMLQQTRVATVLGYWDDWFERFPDVATLAAAELDEVLLAWQGLGYYRRARFLHRGARMVRDDLGGAIPTTYEGLRDIPGLGPYAAGAVASIAFGEPVPAVDGNVRRVLARWFDEADPGDAWYRDQAMELVDPVRPGDWNQALMELGATLCTPTAPVCGACRVASWCAAREAGTQEERPAPARRPKVTARTFVSAVVVTPDGSLLLRKRPADGLLGGMWSFPDVELEARDGWEDVVEVARAVAEGAGVSMAERDGLPMTLAPVRHRFSHIDATYRPVIVAGAAPNREESDGVGALVPVDPGEPGVALPVAQQTILQAAVSALAGEGEQEASGG